LTITNAIAWQQAATGSRLKIPALVLVDCKHGVTNSSNPNITYFPQSIGMGCIQNRNLITEAYRAMATEAAAFGARAVSGPTLSTVRNERWGRTYEAFSESPEINAVCGRAAIVGLQQSSMAHNTSVCAIGMGFAGDGGTLDGICNGNTTTANDATLRSIHLPPFQAAVEDGVGAVMVAFSSWLGTKMVANSALITNTLKTSWNYKGVVISDWEEIMIPGNVATGVNAGVDLAMVPGSASTFITQLTTAVGDGVVPQSRIDDAVRRILRLKFKLDLFEFPTPDQSLAAQIGSAAHRATARQCVRESMVLLKNSGTLPLSKSADIHIVGSWADSIKYQCGGWTRGWQGPADSKLPSGTTIRQALAGACTGQVTYSATGTSIPASADVVVVVVGETPYAEAYGDKADLALTAAHRSLISACAASGKPVVCILLSGRPMIITEDLAQCNAFVAAWLPGTEGGGVADVLFGDYNFTGKLSHTWPIDMEQIPINAGNLGDLSGAGGAPLFEFGFGLQYSK
jgi:beta-glucosidase